MGRPPPLRKGAEPIMQPALAREVESGPRIAPRRTGAQILLTDQSWRPATVLAWSYGTGGMATRYPAWLVQVRLPDGTEHWLVFDKRALRPA